MWIFNRFYLISIGQDDQTSTTLSLTVTLDVVEGCSCSLIKNIS